MSVFNEWFQVYQARIRESLLIRKACLQSDSTFVFEAEPGKLDIQRREPGILFFQFTSWFALQTNNYAVIIDFCVCRVYVIDDVIQKLQRHDDLIKA